MSRSQGSPGTNPDKILVFHFKPPELWKLISVTEAPESVDYDPDSAHHLCNVEKLAGTPLTLEIVPLTHCHPAPQTGPDKWAHTGIPGKQQWENERMVSKELGKQGLWRSRHFNLPSWILQPVRAEEGAREQGTHSSRNWSSPQRLLLRKASHQTPEPFFNKLLPSDLPPLSPHVTPGSCHAQSLSNAWGAPGEPAPQNLQRGPQSLWGWRQHAAWLVSAHTHTRAHPPQTRTVSWSVHCHPPVGTVTQTWGAASLDLLRHQVRGSAHPSCPGTRHEVGDFQAL